MIYLVFMLVLSHPVDCAHTGTTDTIVVRKVNAQSMLGCKSSASEFNSAQTIVADGHSVVSSVICVQEV